MKKVWLVVHPTYKYNEDVKSLALKAGLKVIDAKFSKEIDSEHVEKKPPKLTFKEAYKPKD